MQSFIYCMYCSELYLVLVSKCHSLTGRTTGTCWAAMLNTEIFWRNRIKGIPCKLLCFSLCHLRIWSPDAGWLYNASWITIQDCIHVTVWYNLFNEATTNARIWHALSYNWIPADVVIYKWMYEVWVNVVELMIHSVLTNHINSF